MTLVLAVLLYSSSLAADEVAFKETKQMIQKGDKTEDREVALVLNEGTRTVLVRHRKKEAEVYATIPYDAIHEITYERSTHPRAKTAIFLSPFALFSKGKKHWLTVTFDNSGKSDFVLLQLEKGEYQQILAALETQTGKKIERIVES
jgi:hypothetical protein